MSPPGIIDMRSFMATDLAGIFTYDFPDTILYLGVTYPAIIKDRMIEELDEFGGPIRINAMEIHLQTVSLPGIPNGAILTARGETKEVKSSQLSDDGSELVIYARAA